MNAEQQQAYDWAKSHDYPSIAARYARSLATAVDDLQSQLAESQRRERAAVKDIEKMMRICEKGSCHFCANGDCTESPYCTPKWRGPHRQ